MAFPAKYEGRGGGTERKTEYTLHSVYAKAPVFISISALSATLFTKNTEKTAEKRQDGKKFPALLGDFRKLLYLCTLKQSI